MDHSSAAIGLEENKITAAIEPESPSSSSSSSSPVPAIKLKRKCSSGWTLSNNGTHSASAAGTTNYYLYIPLYLDVVYFCICCSIQEEWWNTQVAMIAIIHKQTRLFEIRSYLLVVWSFGCIYIIYFNVSIISSGSLFHQSKSSFVLVDKPVSSDSHQWCVSVRAAVVFLLYFR